MLDKVKDYPALGTALVAGVVALHWAFYDVVSIFPDVARTMAAFEEAWSIYAGFGAVVAVVAGFAGVVVVFALSSESAPFRQARTEGEDRLEANWVSPVASTLGAAFGSFGAAVLSVAGSAWLAWWLFEFVVLLAIVASLRLVWLFKRLVALVRASDRQPQGESGEAKSIDQIHEAARKGA